LRYVEAVPPQAEALLHPDAPPTTVIYPHIRHLPHHLLAADGSLGIRMARHPFCEQLIAAIDVPLVSTSANFGGEPAAVHFADLSEALRKQVDYTVSDLSAYYEPRGLPSRIVRLSRREYRNYQKLKKRFGMSFYINSLILNIIFNEHFYTKKIPQKVLFVHSEIGLA